ncbi:Transporter [Azospirillaceae bacterium]
MSPLMYALIPTLCVVIGAILAISFIPGKRAISAFQHLAAGVVFAAAAGEILPEISAHHNVIPILIGGALGILVTYLIKCLDIYYPGPSSFILSIAIDLLIDGVVIGVGFVAGASQGYLLTFALSMEVLFLGLALTSSLSTHMSSLGIVLLSVALGVLLPIGATIGNFIGGAPQGVIVAVYTFSLIALLYLVTEELLVEAHELYDTPEITALFFIGFLGVVLVEHIAKN